MPRKYEKYVGLHLTTEARTLLDDVVAGLRAQPVAPESGRATISSVASVALVEGLRVLIARHGLPIDGGGPDTGNPDGSAAGEKNGRKVGASRGQ